MAIVVQSAVLPAAYLLSIPRRAHRMKIFHVV
jgi:hypothetical protein